MIELTYDAVDVSNAISVIEAITGLLHQYIAVSVKVHTKHGSSSDSTTSARMCFGSIGMLTGVKTTTNSNCDSSRDSLMCNLLKLLNVLVQIPLPNQRGQNQRGRSTSMETSPTDATVPVAAPSDNQAVDSPLTDFSKMSQHPGVMTSTPGEEQQTDEQKTENAAAQAAAAANSPRLSNRGSRSCTHYPNSRHPEQAVKEAALADVILARPHIMVQLLQVNYQNIVILSEMFESFKVLKSDNENRNKQ